MISYEPLWQTMKRKGITTYTLITKFGIASSTVNSLRHNQNIEMLTLEKLCFILDCEPNDIVKFIKD